MAKFATPNLFCPRHMGFTLIVRCKHKGKRFVAQVQGYYKPNEGCVDYVEDGADGHITGCQTFGYFKTPEEAEVLWRSAVAALNAGLPVGDD